MIPKLLVIDSDAFNREITRKIFSGKYEMTFSASPAEFEQVCAVFMPDAALFEVRANDKRYLGTLLKTARSHTPSIPVVLAISENSFDLEKRARVDGAFYCLARPFDPRELWDALDSAIAFSASHGPNIDAAVVR